VMMEQKIYSMLNLKSWAMVILKYPIAQEGPEGDRHLLMKG